MVNGSIVYETEPFFSDDKFEDKSKAMYEVNKYVMDRIAFLFSEDFPMPAPAPAPTA